MANVFLILMVIITFMPLVSYRKNLGHCASDDSEPRLFRYKEECEDACTKGNTGKEVTYATAGLVGADTTTISFPTISTRGADVPKTDASTTDSTKTNAPKTDLPKTDAPKTDAPKTDAPLIQSKKCPGGLLPLKDAQGLLVDCSKSSCPPSFSCHSSICCQLIVQKEPSREQSPILDGTSTTITVSEASPLPLPETEKSVENINICSLPKDRGSCDQYQMRFYFNKDIGECKYFFYGGCEGNANNFARVEDCEKACVKSLIEAKEKIQPISQTNSVPVSSSPLPIQTTTSNVFSGIGKNIVTEVKLPFSSRTTLPPPTLPIEPDTPQLSVITFQPEIDKQDLFSQLPERKQQISPLLDLNKCQHPKDAGICAAQFVRWFWNPELHTCETFTYTGCGGNGNNFASREECLNVCREELTTDTSNDDTTKSVCDVDIDPGNCGGIFMRYGFDRRTAQCRQFQYGGCEGNGNNFPSLLDCRRRCLDEPEEPLSPNICEHRIDPGTCSGTFHRFGYETLTNRCTKFVYGGCGGNGNNFASIDDCRVACVRHICPPEPECDTRGRCQLVKDSKGCSLCSCPPPRHPSLIPSVPPLAPAVEPRINCPQLDVKLCSEPCIIFLNRRGCRECVCPIIPPNSFHESPAPPSIQEPPSPPSIQSVSVPQINKQQQHASDFSSSAPLPPASFPSVPLFSTAPPVHPPKPPIIGGVLSNKQLEPLPPPTTESPLPSSPRSQTLTKKLPQSETIISQTVTPEPIAFGHNEICTQPLDIGASACSRFVQRWYFSSESGQCESFSYTGCAGNRNHFFSKKECQIYCARFSRARTSTSDDGLLLLTPEDVQTSISQDSTSTSTTTSQEPLQSSSIKSGISDSSSDQISTTAARIEHPEISNKLPVETQNKEEDLDNERRENEEINLPEFQTFSSSSLPPIDSRVLLRSRIVPEAPIQNGVNGRQDVIKEKPIPIKTTERRVEQPPSIPLLKFETAENKNVESTDIPGQTAPSTVISSTLSQFIQKQNTKLVEKTKLSVHSIQIPLNKIENKNRDELSIRSTQLPEIESTYSILENKEDEQKKENEEKKVEVKEEDKNKEGEEQKEQKLQTKFEDGEDNQFETIPENLEIFSTLQPTIILPKIPKLQTIKIEITPENSEAIIEDKINNEATQTTTINALISGEGRVEDQEEEGRTIISTKTEETDDDLIWVKLRERENGRKFKNQEEEKEEKHSEGLISNEAEASEPLGTSVPSFEESDKKEIPSERNLQPLPEHEEKSLDLFSNQHIKQEQQIPIQPSNLGEQKQEQHGEEANRQIIPNNERQQLPIIPHEVKGKEEQPKALPELEIDGLKQPSNKINDSTEDTQSELLPIDPANEFSPQSSTFSQENLEPNDQISTDIPLRLAPQAPVSSRPKLQRPLPPVQHMIIPHIQNKHEICSLPPVAGPCTSFVLRWFFNPENGICEQFSYGSCRGNLNNFPNKSQCEAVCLDNIPQKVQLNDRCTLDRDEGTGTGYNVHWYFNVRNLRCEQFVWQGNDGNANRFDTEAECKSICEQTNEKRLRPKETDDLTQQLNIPPPAGRMRAEIDNQLARGAKTADTQNEVGDVGIPAPLHTFDGFAKSTDVEPTIDSLSLMPETTNEPESNFEQSTISQAPLHSGLGNNNNRDGYAAIPLPKEPPKMPDLPLLGKSMLPNIDYVEGKRLDTNPSPPVLSGLPQHVPEQNSANKNMLPTHFNDDKSDIDPAFSFSKSVGTIANGVPICPNGLNTMLYSDGRPVLCLPGMGQCPEKSVCYFNGIDYFCCPNEDDPYDQHIFGGYDGEELKHGYKAGSTQQQQSSLRVRRQNKENGPSSSLLTESLRFDDKSPPGPIQRQSRFHGNVKGSNAICYQPLNKGNCGEALPRYFYDSESDRCRHFYFTGCGGNENKFGTIIECERSCKRGQESPEQSPSTQKRPGVCPGGNLPLGGRNPVLCGEHYDSIGCPTGFLCVPGPPSVCCPTKYEKSEIRRKPQQNINNEQMLEVKPAPTEENLHLKNQNIAELNVHLMLCSDGSDPLRNETSGEIISCGAGVDVDGQSHCEFGFYCSIDHDSNTRFCCPLQSTGAKLDSSSSPNEVLAPHFGRRPPNPGEVLGRGSHPSDRHNRLPLTSSASRKNSSSSRRDVEFGQLRIERSKLGAIGEEKNTRTANSKDWRPSEEDPFESAAVCLLRPVEGRLCAKGERTPRSNLQYFYSTIDGKCKDVVEMETDLTVKKNVSGGVPKDETKKQKKNI
uniref:Kunitz/Bovine pancreatic trypsin inhibitor domain protein n=1 Tax=Meloidogyne hapla TaxID=6305 RepID=A0A1I8BS33_MELHA